MLFQRLITSQTVVNSVTSIASRNSYNYMNILSNLNSKFNFGSTANKDG
jgi:hypothetical protein